MTTPSAPGEPRTPEAEAAYQAGRQAGITETRRRQLTPRMTGWRVACGICWAFWTLVLAISFIVGLSSGSAGSALICLVLAALAGWYDYRIWALKARYLSLFIIF